jgi:hypothetical protein
VAIQNLHQLITLGAWDRLNSWVRKVLSELRIVDAPGSGQRPRRAEFSYVRRPAAHTVGQQTAELIEAAERRGEHPWESEASRRSWEFEVLDVRLTPGPIEGGSSAWLAYETLAWYSVTPEVWYQRYQRSLRCHAADRGLTSAAPEFNAVAGLYVSRRAFSRSRTRASRYCWWKSSARCSSG